MARTAVCKRHISGRRRLREAAIGLALLAALVAASPAQASRKSIPYNDFPRGSGSTVQPQFVGVCAWGETSKFYNFVNGTSDIAGEGEESAVESGMSLWSQVSPVVLLEWAFAPAISIKWATGEHGDGAPFDGVGNTLAHSILPCERVLPGDVHFDDAETWTTSTRPEGGQPIDLTTASAHEVGHALGLDESCNPERSACTTEEREALMYPFYSGSHRYLGWDDIAGIQSLYGRRNGTFHLRDTNTAGSPNSSFLYQNLGDLPVAGDWNGDGTETIGIWRPSNKRYYVRNGNPFGEQIELAYGITGDVPITGDWNGDRRDTVAVFRPSTTTFYLKNRMSGAETDIFFRFGNAEDRPIVGDWNGDGVDSIGVYRPRTSTFYLRNTNSEGAADYTFAYGSFADLPVAGDWNGDGIDTVGHFTSEGSFALLTSNNFERASQILFAYGSLGGSPVTNARPVVGDWNGDRSATVGIYQN